MSVNHSADVHSDLSMAHNVSHKDLAMCGELLVAHDSGGKSHGELYMACDACNITQREPIGSAEHCYPERDDSHNVIWERSHMNSSQVKTCGVSTNPSRRGEQVPYVSEDLELHGEPPPCEANDLLVTADADHGPREALPPHRSTGQSSEHVEALAPWLRRQVDDVNPQEHRESIARDACDALGRVESFGPMRLAMQRSEHHWCSLKHTIPQGMTEMPLTGHLAAEERNRHRSNPIPPRRGQTSRWQVPVHDHCVRTSPYPRAKHRLSPCHL